MKRDFRTATTTSYRWIGLAWLLASACGARASCAAPVPTLVATAAFVSPFPIHGVPFTVVVANVTDSRPSDTAASLVATITWGDGTSSAGVVAGGAGAFTVTGTHTYALPGAVSTLVSITRTPTGPTVVASGSIKTLTIGVGSGGGFTAKVGVPFSAAVVNVNDPNLNDTAADLAAAITWGDGASDVGVVVGSAGSFTVNGTHSYASTGTFAGGVVVTDTLAGFSVGPIGATVTVGH